MSRLIIFAIIIAIVIWILRAKNPIRVTLTSSGVLDSKGVSNAALARMADFARDNVEYGESVTLYGRRIENGLIRCELPKNVKPEFAQRFRSFMINEV